MIVLGSRGAAFSGDWVKRPGQLYRVSDNPHRPAALKAREVFLCRVGTPPPGFVGYITIDGGTGSSGADGAPLVHLPAEFDYLADGDIVRLEPEHGFIRVLYRRSSPHNSFLLTERCNNYCLMCSQPPRNVQDGWLVDELLEAMPLIDPETKEIGFTGGEPTLLGDRFLELVRAAKSYLPRTSLHVLSNGRTFSNNRFAAALAQIDHHDLMIGIPVYSDLAHLHDYVVQADGAFDETIRGILNLKRHGVGVEVRVVLHKQTADRLPQLAEFLSRNLRFVDHVALMGLEMMGFTRANLDALWIDPADYQDQLRDAVWTLRRARMTVSVYNAQLCLTDPSIWAFAKRSISDWKQEYMPECDGCAVMDQCAGFFASAKHRYSDRIRPISAEAARMAAV